MLFSTKQLLLIPQPQSNHPTLLFLLLAVQVWGTPLIKHCAVTVAISWITCEAIMGSVQIFVVIYNISIDTNQVAAILLCYVMQLLPLLWAVIFTFAYPAYIKRRWGYQDGIRSTCYPRPTSSGGISHVGTVAPTDSSWFGSVSTSISTDSGSLQQQNALT